MGTTVTRRWISVLLILIVWIPLFTAGCSGRKVGTSVQDQTIAAGHPKTAERPKTESERVMVPDTAPQPSAPPRGPLAPPAREEAPVPAVPEEKPTEAKILEELRRSEPEMAVAERPFVGKEEAEAVVTPPPDVVSPIELADVFFDFDDFTIRSDAKMILDANAQLLSTYADGTVVIEGHCDERGSADYNLVLGERRAQAVKRYLQKHGVQASRMRVITYGKERPFCTLHTDECYQKNRRAHFVFGRE